MPHDLDIDECEKSSIASDPEFSFSFVVENKHKGMRLDQCLSLLLPEKSRTQILESNKKNLIFVDDSFKKSSYKLKLGEKIVGSLWQALPPQLKAEKIDFPIIFEDDHILVISKPPGLVVHPGNGNQSGTLVHGLLHHCQSIRGVGDEIRPGIVHRLDKDTSGVMIVAKDEKSMKSLQNDFKNRETYKIYHTLVAGIPNAYEGRIVAPIGRHSVNRQKMAVCERKGRYAATNWQGIEAFENDYGRYTLIRVHIETGRTHQIRVHMNHIGHSVVGDKLYGRRNQNPLFQRQMLHASRLRILHPVTGKKMTFNAPLWEDFETALHTLDWCGSLSAEC
ncbi:MAG: RluA family pseudouridine synthase [Desulfotalea sp.]